MVWVSAILIIIPDQELSGDTQTLGVQEEELSYRNLTTLEGDTYSKLILSDSSDQELSGDTQTLGIQEEKLSYMNPTKRENSMFDDSNDVKLFSMASIEFPDYYNENLTGKFEDGPKAWATKVDIVKISTIEDAIDKGETYLFMNELRIDHEFMVYLAAIRDGNPVMGNNPLVEVYFSVFVDDWAKKRIYLLPFGAFQPILNVAEKGEADRNTLLFLFEEAYKDLLRTSRANLPSSQSDFDALRMIAVPAMHFETPVFLVADFKSKILLSNHGTSHKEILISPMSYSGGKSGIFNAVQRVNQLLALGAKTHISQGITVKIQKKYESDTCLYYHWKYTKKYNSNTVILQGQQLVVLEIHNKDNVGLYMIGTILLLLYNPDISLSELRDCIEIPDTFPVIRGSMLEQISTVILKAEL
ncbi:hypothetical protein K435DRAFT_803135 [Dendrothele bispora CBS 962.96]|uniref:Uncharacterized protein n=1 Tax=Dendrothele bispora (strain CBS 962.96) TaxID=1314807 RepID=A0A4S8LII8_DENBC|nr:hypothetical protein K435DRAFT_803135 [Dendrothele bispora CBS 962.96]